MSTHRLSSQPLGPRISGARKRACDEHLAQSLQQRLPGEGGEVHRARWHLRYTKQCEHALRWVGTQPSSRVRKERRWAALALP